MALNVKQLIAKLKKMPPNVPVYWADHDQSAYETNALVNSVRLMNQADMEDWERKTIEVELLFEGDYVLLRP